MMECVNPKTHRGKYASWRRRKIKIVNKVTQIALPRTRLCGRFLECEPNINRDASFALEKNSWKGRRQNLRIFLLCSSHNMTTKSVCPARRNGEDNQEWCVTTTVRNARVPHKRQNGFFPLSVLRQLRFRSKAKILMSSCFKTTCEVSLPLKSDLRTVW